MAERIPCGFCGGSGQTSHHDKVGHQTVPCQRCAGMGWTSSPTKSSTTQHNNNTDCFPGYVKIKTPLGYKPLALINEGDEVLSLNAFGKIEAKPVFKKKIHSFRRILTIRTGHSSFDVTKAHSIKTLNGYKRAGQLRVGDVLIVNPNSSNLEQVEVTEIIDSGDVADVYNLVVEGNYTFIAEGVVAHSFSRLKNIRISLCNLMFWLRSSIPSQDAQYLER